MADITNVFRATRVKRSEWKTLPYMGGSVAPRFYVEQEPGAYDENSPRPASECYSRDEYAIGLIISGRWYELPDSAPFGEFVLLDSPNTNRYGYYESAADWFLLPADQLPARIAGVGRGILTQLARFEVAEDGSVVTHLEAVELVRRQGV